MSPCHQHLSFHDHDYDKGVITDDYDDQVTVMHIITDSKLAEA
jgi:hypothetical protein